MRKTSKSRIEICRGRSSKALPAEGYAVALLLLWIITITTTISGCQKEALPEVTGTGKEKVVNNVSQEIECIAKNEVVKRQGWTGQLKADVDKTERGWEVIVWRVPETSGGHTTVKISPDRKVIEYLRGK